MTRDELLEALLVERQDQTWWHRRPGRPQSLAQPQEHSDDDVTTARRRKAAMDEWNEHEKEVV